MRKEGDEQMMIQNRLFGVCVPLVLRKRSRARGTKAMFWALQRNPYPLMHVTQDDIDKLQLRPLWLWQLSPHSEVGVDDNTSEKEYVVSGFKLFEDYCKWLNKGTRYTLHKLSKSIEVSIEKPGRKAIESMYREQYPKIANGVIDECFDLYMDMFTHEKAYAYVGRKDGEVAGMNMVVKDNQHDETHCLGVVLPQNRISGLGIYLNLMAIKDAIDENRKYNLGYGKYEYKERLCNEKRAPKRLILADKDFMKRAGTPI